MLLTLRDKALAAATLRGDGRRFLVGAAIMRADGATVVSRNEGSAYPCPDAHAEARALRKAGFNPQVVVVVRVRKADGELAMAKPCEWCAARLKAAGAREVWYTDDFGNLIRWR